MWLWCWYRVRDLLTFSTCVLQVHDLLCSTHVLQLSQLCTLLRCGRGQVTVYLDALQECGVLVQGCWVLSSLLAHPKGEEADIRCVRDYIVRWQ